MLPDMLLVGLTGNIGSGKSAVGTMLARHGATLIDADVLARRAVEPGTPAHERIVARWGTEVQSPDGHLDRAALRRIVFADHDQLEELNQIVHPEVERMSEEAIAEAHARGDRIVVCDIPLLFEEHLTDRFDRIVLVDAPRPVRLERLVGDRGLREPEAMEMIAAQMPAELKRARADYIIENNGTMTQLERRVRDLWGTLADEASGRDAAATIP
jgi:dephospho-CoA kinase